MGVLLDGYDQLVDKLQTITGLRVFDDPRNINPPCVLVEAPTFIMQSNVIAELQFNVKLIGLGPGNYTALKNLLDQADLIRAAKIGLKEGRPTVTTVGAQDFSSYDLTINTKIAP